MTTLEKFYEELNEYIDDKIPDVDLSVRRELAVFVVQRVAIRERDVVDDVAQQFRMSMRGSANRDRRDLMERSKKLTEERKATVNTVGGPTVVE